jgi:hypothetical protein
VKSGRSQSEVAYRSESICVLGYYLEAATHQSQACVATTWRLLTNHGRGAASYLKATHQSLTGVHPTWRLLTNHGRVHPTWRPLTNHGRACILLGGYSLITGVHPTWRLLTNHRRAYYLEATHQSQACILLATLGGYSPISHRRAYYLEATHQPRACIKLM